jgi:hypothetical protein
MSEPAVPAPEASGPAAEGEAPIHPRSDLRDGLGWTALGAAILIGSIRMDRLEAQHINPYTVPGLLPGLLGIAMILLGGILALRSWRRGALRLAMPAPTADEREERRRVWITVALCMGYAVVLVGHGLPFWLASAIYVTGSILILQHLSRDADERRFTVRSLVKAVAIGVGSGVITSVVFQEFFLVRMP